MTKRYTLTLTEEQVKVVDRALDVFSRLHAGQFDVIVHDIYQQNPPAEGEDRQAFYVRRDMLAKSLRFPETLMTNLEPNAHHSIGSKHISDSARVAYDILKVIRYQQWQEHGCEPAWNVYGHEPYQMSQEPLPSFARVQEEETILES